MRKKNKNISGLLENIKPEYSLVEIFVAKKKVTDSFQNNSFMDLAFFVFPFFVNQLFFCFCFWSIIIALNGSGLWTYYQTQFIELIVRKNEWEKSAMFVNFTIENLINSVCVEWNKQVWLAVLINDDLTHNYFYSIQVLLFPLYLHGYFFWKKNSNFYGPRSQMMFWYFDWIQFWKTMMNMNFNVSCLRVCVFGFWKICWFYSAIEYFFLLSFRGLFSTKKKDSLYDDDRYINRYFILHYQVHSRGGIWFYFRVFFPFFLLILLSGYPYTVILL